MGFSADHSQQSERCRNYAFSGELGLLSFGYVQTYHLIIALTKRKVNKNSVKKALDMPYFLLYTEF